ncbi:Pentatricopeptide repeat (PPR) superfamily protein [Rhynchospora pubera]|uniref:Pentatricopeptide repeat (PPR) superfamily protein n=1 Tax=Rhynchospora pubera TaxID=906938 RepID=A0AAV8EDV6_9POAL|nr:Pentatricopeptide repeat (PPR) superfamily protein [Rhynchospora pubera]
MISAGVSSSQYHVSISIFKEMMEKNAELDPTTLVVLLSAVSCARLLKHGMVIHGIAIKKSFNLGTHLCNALISMYSKCGELSSSEHVFQIMQYRDTTSWNSIINGSHFGKLYEKSISYFTEMISCGLQPDEFSISTALSSCTSLDCTFNLGESIHGLVIKTCTCHGSVSNALVSFYSQYRDIEAAKRVFLHNDNKNVISWNSIIKGLVENGRDTEVFQFFQDMQFKNATKPDAVTLIALIPLCGELNLPLEVKSIHGYSIRYEMQSVNSSIGNSLMDAYFSCDHERYALNLFNNMPNRDLFSWNIIISGYAENDFFHEDARFLFSELIRAGLGCSLPSFLGVLPSISRQEDLKFGKLIHGMVLKYGYDSSIAVINALMHMYMSCGKLSDSFYLLKSIIFESDVISWNTIITGCVQKGLAREAIETFQLMHSNLSLYADFITIESILLACTELEALTWGNMIHALLRKRPIQFDVGVNKALVTMYLKVGDLRSANKVYGFGCEENSCIWNCMISSYVQNLEGAKALELYCGNRDKFSSANEITIVSLICACSQIADFRHGKEINGYVFRYGLQNNVYIMASLIDLYSKCGVLDIAMKIFEFSEEKSIASWNSMISAYGIHGQGENSIRLFHKMCNSGIKPTKSTFVALLSACSQTGLVEEGLKYYNLMPQKFGVRHSVEHIVCVIDLLGRAGRVEEAYQFVKDLGVCQDHGVWGALLSACNEGNGDVITGRKVAGHLFSMQQENAGYYVTLCNLFASHEMWDYVEEVRRIFRIKGLVKPKAISVID